MKLAPMRYKNYVWPHNPRIYEISFRRNIAVNRVPFSGYIMTDMGTDHRILKGEGEFVGAGAYDEFKKLASLFYDASPGILVHPTWQSANVYFVSLKLRQEPREDYVSYTFEFWEKYDGLNETVTLKAPAEVKPEANTAARKYHVVTAGDTMWAIARDNGITLEKLIELNPQIKNPNRIYSGDKIYLS